MWSTSRGRRFDQPPRGTDDDDVVGAGSQEPLVSLVMPVWNPRADWLREAVASVLAQEKCVVELVVVDDGSSEPASALLEHVHDDRLRIVRIEHAGTSAARNAGVAAARGEWLRFVDYDDVLPVDSTAHLLTIAGSDDVIPYGATEICDAELRTRAKMVSRLGGDVVRPCLLDEFEVTLPALLFSRRLVERIGTWDVEIPVCQDWDYMLRAFELAPARGDSRTVLFYRRHALGASAGSLAEGPSLQLATQGMRRVLDRYFERHPEGRGTHLERLARARVELVIARSHREAYLLHLGRALAGDRAGVVRELRVFARLVGRRALDRTIRRVTRRLEQATITSASAETGANGSRRRDGEPER
jgi:Glycosyl transferase family 2